MTSKIRTVGCILEFDRKLVLLHRPDHKSQGGKWGLVAGKAEPGESEEKTIIREIKEETGYNANESELEFLGSWNWHFDEKIVEFPVFRIKLKEKIDVKIDPNEHDEFRWVTPTQAYAMPDLVHGVHDLFELLGWVKDLNRKNSK
ncbi:NUDIX domain-containing protein [Candidatus Woesearchaeota archaeon]|jgi:8-oxo-dGTP diphosphatase|nr:NUDIX domain-containing protein [Candidatus Woesearchaeota archaeon]MBT6520451.1 NUDIX domain-containing protein [Candidatus Woesearchaeota archaeon]MBT7367345.1 NUDIX domain-containing protein [Candidatus Woesearchaeota archaeon]